MGNIDIFIEEYTNARSFYEAPYEHEEELENIDFTFYNRYLTVNGTNRWYINWMRRQEKYYKESEEWILTEERLTHPIIAMQFTYQKMKTAHKQLLKIENDITANANYLREKGGVVF